jgi:hypothetical protein
VRRHHYSAEAAGGLLYCHGLYRVADGEWGAPLWGAALWMNAVNLSRRFDLPAGALMLHRLVCVPEAPRNAASFLLAHSMRLLDRSAWPVLVTYADSAQGHSGAIYRATNWTDDGVGGGVTYLHPETGRQISSLGPGGQFRSCPPGWQPARSEKARFIHDARAAAASSDAPVVQTGEGGSQPTPPLHQLELAL